MGVVKLSESALKGFNDLRMLPEKWEIFNVCKINSVVSLTGDTSRNLSLNSH